MTMPVVPEKAQKYVYHDVVLDCTKCPDEVHKVINDLRDGDTMHNGSLIGWEVMDDIDEDGKYRNEDSKIVDDFLIELGFNEFDIVSFYFHW